MDNEKYLVDLKTVQQMMSMGKTAIYSLKDFPRPIKLGRSSRWVVADLKKFIQKLSEPQA